MHSLSSKVGSNSDIDEEGSPYDYPHYPSTAPKVPRRACLLSLDISINFWEDVKRWGDQQCSVAKKTE